MIRRSAIFPYAELKHVPSTEEQNATLQVELEKVTVLLEHWTQPGNKVLSGAMTVVAKGYAASARLVLDQIGRRHNETD
jgi:hypothetical protein